jgi:flagellar hook-basal body complex protein FliE
MSDILYNFGSNAASIQDIQKSISDINEVSNDIDTLFSAVRSVYDGEGATAMDAAHQKVSAMLQDALHDANNTQQFAQDQQDAMQALDRANAAQF